MQRSAGQGAARAGFDPNHEPLYVFPVWHFAARCSWSVGVSRLCAEAVSVPPSFIRLGMVYLR